jgi:hypothetical protein
MKKYAAILIGALAISSTSIYSPTSAAPSATSIALYFSAPFVTGSHVTDSATTETFNSFTAGACPTTWAVGTVTGTGCQISSQAGTSTGNSSPAIGVPNSSFAYGNLNTTVTLQTPAKYVGFWWMMGSQGNSVDFYDSTNTLITMNVNDVLTAIGVTEAQAGTLNYLTNDTGTLSSVEGGTHLRKRYYRGPSVYTGTVENPVFNYDDAAYSYANQPWIYLNLFITGGSSVTKIVFTGPNFEIDNLTVSSVESGPSGDMVLAKTIAGTPPAAQVMTWAPTNTSINGGSNVVTPNNLGLVTTPSTGGGAITYSVLNAGTSGCTVNSSTGVITYSAAGTCVVRSTAAAVSGYFAASKDVSFTFTTAPTIIESTSSNPTVNSVSTSAVPELANTGVGDLRSSLAITFLLFGFGLVLFSRKLRQI